MQEKAKHSLWDYACQRYAQPGVAQKLLYLQDTHGLVVNMLLLLHWLGANGRTLDEKGMAHCLAAIRPLEDDILKPLRQSRRMIKQTLGDSDEYQACKQLELQLEQQVLQRLQKEAQGKAFNVDEKDAIFGNIKRYIHLYAQSQTVADDWLDF